MSSKATGLRNLRQRISALFQDHEIFIRTHGHVRFLRVSAVWQKRVALIAGIVLLAWAGVTLAILANQMLSSGERAEVAAQKAAATAAEAAAALMLEMPAIIKRPLLCAPAQPMLLGFSDASYAQWLAQTR